MVGQWALYRRNGAGDRSQTWSKVTSKVVLLKYSAIAIFEKIAIWRVFPDRVTYCTGSNFEVRHTHVGSLQGIVVPIQRMSAIISPEGT